MCDTHHRWLDILSFLQCVFGLFGKNQVAVGTQTCIRVLDAIGQCLSFFYPIAILFLLL